MTTLAINSFPVFLCNLITMIIVVFVLFGWMGICLYLSVKYHPIYGLILMLLSLIIPIALFVS